MCDLKRGILLDDYKDAMVVFPLFRVAHRNGYGKQDRNGRPRLRPPAMISLDGSIIAAIIVFLTLIFTLNSLLFQPLLRIQAEREARTTGFMDQARKHMDHHLELFNRYQAAIKNERLAGYQVQERVRADAMGKRTEALAAARKRTEDMIRESREALQAQTQTAKEQLTQEAREIARSIAENILRRPA
jgi:F-type H+-transporting ATPase subunit b